MDFGLNDDQRDIQGTARALVAERASAERVREHAEAGTTDTALWKELGDIGWPGIAIAEEHGGQGLGMVELAILCEELGRAIAPVPFLPTVAAAAILEQGGSDEQRARWLPDLAAGRALGAVAAFMTPGSVLFLRQLQFVGVFAAGMATLAIVRADGVVTVRGRERRPPWPALAVVLFMVWVAAPLNHLNHVPFALGVCCLLVALGTGSLIPLRRMLEWRGIVWMGAVSLSLYLIHAPIVHGTWLTALRPAGHGVGDIETLVLLLPLAVGASLLAGWLFHRYVEQPLAPRAPTRARPADAAPVAERVS
ncbi:MAG: acyl-CoA dehydrogenase family protein [Baekduiaceae bacterium]